MSADANRKGGPREDDAVFDHIRATMASLGCGSITEFMALFPGESFDQLAARLGVAEAWHVCRLRFEGLDSKDRRIAAKDALSRELRGVLSTDGWGNGSEGSIPGQRGVFAISPLKQRSLGWIALVSGQGGVAMAVLAKVWSALESLPPPPGWVPRLASDPFIERAFEIGWPESD